MVIASVINVVIDQRKIRSCDIIEKGFTDISEFNVLDAYAVDSSAKEDRYLGNLQPEESYVKTVNYCGESFDVYAYVFETDDDAFAYYEQVSGVKTSIQDSCYYFLGIRNMRDIKYIFYYKNYAYLITGSDYVKTAEFINWLTADFPIDYREVFYEENGRWPQG